MKKILIALVLCNSVWCQTPTKPRLSTQSQTPDFRTFAATFPLSVGASLPATCAVGQLYFLTTATAGQNVYLCASINVWSAVSSAATGSVTQVLNPTFTSPLSFLSATTTNQNTTPQTTFSATAGQPSHEIVGTCGTATSVSLCSLVAGDLPQIPLTNLLPEAANTLVGNATASSASPMAIAVPSCPGANQALSWTSGTGFGCNTISSTGGTPGGSSTSVQINNAGAFGGVVLGDAQLLFGQTSANPAAHSLSQDCTVTDAGVITCTKTNNVAFATSATTDTTNAGNISTGTISAARLPAISLTSGVSGILPVANGGNGTATPGIQAGTNVTVTGSWPTQTVSASGSGGGLSDPGANGMVYRSALNTTRVGTQGTDFQGGFALSAPFYGNGTTTGIAGAVTACTALATSCSILVPPSYALTETEPGFIIDPNNPTGNGNSTMSANTMLFDQRFGDLQFSNNNYGYHYVNLNSTHPWQYNYGNPMPANNSFNVLNMQTNFFGGGSNVQDSATGYYNKPTMNGQTMYVNSYTPGQHIALGTTTISTSIGDALGIVNFVRCAAGFSAQFDEGCEAQNNRVYELNQEYVGPLTGTPTTSSVTVSPTQGVTPFPTQGAGRYLIRTNTGTISTGTISAITTADGSPTVMTGSSTSWPTSTVVGTLGTQVSAPYVTGATCASPIVITVGLAETVANGASATVTGVEGLTAANGTWTVTTIDSTHFSLNTSTCSGQTYIAGGYVAVPQVITPSAFSIGSMSGITTSTPVVIASYGNYEIVVPTAVTSTTFSAIIRKTYPTSATIAVGGLAGYLMDLKADEVTSSTFPNYTDEQVVGTLRYAWPVLYSTSATSATVWVSGGGAYRALVTRWQAAGTNTYTLYQNAEVTSVQTGGNVSNTLSLAPGTINTAWSSGDTVEELIYPAHSMRLGNTIIQYRYPCFATAACGAGITYNAPMIGNDQLWGVSNTAPTTMYKSGGGTYDSPIAFRIAGVTRYGFFFDDAPDSALIGAGCQNNTSNCNQANAVLMQLGAYSNTTDYMLHDETVGQWRWSVHGGATSFWLGYSTTLSQGFFGPYTSNQGYLGAPSNSWSGAYYYERSSCGANPASGALCIYANTDGTFHQVNSSGVDTSIGSGGGGGGTNATQFQGVAISSTTPTNNQAFVYNSTSGNYPLVTLDSLVAGLGTAVSGTTAVQVNVVNLVRAVTTTTDALLPADCGNEVTYSNASAISISLSAPGLSSNFVNCPITLHNYGAGTATFTFSGGTIGGASTLALTTGQSAVIVANTTSGEYDLGVVSGSGGGGLTNIAAFNVLANNTNASAVPAATTAVGMFGIMGDDQTNAVGLGAAASLRKTIYTDHVTGLTIGAGQNNTVRGANCTALQAVFNAAATNGWQVQIVPGVYEIYCSTGLTINNTTDTNALWIRGSQQARIIQFYANAPAVTIGDTAASATDYSINVNIDGLRLEYGVSQTSNTGANLLQIGALRSSTLNHIWLGADGGSYTAPNTPYLYPAYRPFYIVSGATAPFSDTFENFFIQGGQYRLVDLSGLAGGTGNIFSNWYVTNGYNIGNQLGQVSNCALYIAGADGGIFDQFNIEGVIANVVVNAQTYRGGIFDSFHFEGIQLTGSNPIIWQAGTDRLKFGSLDVTGLFLSSGTLNTLTASGTGSVISTYGDDTITADHLTVQLQDSGNVVNLPLVLFTTGNVGDTQPSIEMTNFTADDLVSGGLLANLSLDSNTPLANFAGPSRISHYKWGPSISHIDGAVRPVSSTYTVYGQDTDVTIQVPPSITSFTLTLADVNGASGNASTSIPKVGNIVHVRRDSGSISGTLTIADATAGTLATNSVSAADIYFKFDGTRWRTIADSISIGLPSAINLAASGSGGVTGTLGVSNGGTGTTTPNIVAGSNISVTGTWPNQTVSATGTGTAITFSPPYQVASGNYYLQPDFGFQATLPPAFTTGYSALSGTMTPSAGGGNGDINLSSLYSTAFLQQTAAISSSVESVFSVSEPNGFGAANTYFGIYACDSTNNKIWGLYVDTQSGSPASVNLVPYTVTSCTTANTPSLGTSAAANYFVGSVPHIKLSWSSGTLTASQSFNGGASYKVIQTESVGTIAASGVMGNGTTSTVYSFKVQ